MEKKGNNKALIIALVLVFGGFAVCGCGGILAAIAIPAFQKFQNASKSAEARVTTRALASNAEIAFSEGCAFPSPFASTFDPTQCCGGEMCVATGEGPDWASNVSLNETFYAYSAQPGPGDTFVITATKDFNCSGAPHTISITVRGSKEGESCHATSDPAVDSGL